MSDDDIQPILSHELAALCALPPWRDLGDDVVASVLAQAELCFFARGALMLHADLEAPACLVVRDGGVHVLDADAPATAQPLLHLPPGAPLPLLPTPAARLTHVAADDLYCWRIAAADWTRLRDHPALLRWQLARAAELARALQDRHRDDHRAGHAALRIMALAVGTLPLPRASVTPDSPLADAAVHMRGQAVDALAVVQAGALRGILGEAEVLRAVAEGRTPDCAVAEAMSPAPHAIAASCTVADAAQELCTRALRHLPVTDDGGAFAGLLSADALFRLQRSGFGYFAAPMEQARDLEELAAAVQDMRGFAARLFLDGAGAAPLTAVISALNDRVVQRVLRLAGGDALADLRYCWLAFGSEGRHEQTLSTDQDNGILFDAAGDPQALRERLLEFAERVNTGLDRCGFPLCKGNIMARNPRWCLSLDEWREQFSSWIRTPGPEALLNANIFFDFNPVHGDAGLAEALRRHLFSLSRDNSIFLAMMAENALRVGPPLGAFGRFATDGGENAGTIDLKRQGSRLFVDAGRVFALAHGIHATHTGERLRLGGVRLRREPRVVAADVAAFNVLLGIRMGNQLRRDAADPHDPNRVDPHALNDIDQRVLREALHQAQLLQERLKLEYTA